MGAGFDAVRALNREREYQRLAKVSRHASDLEAPMFRPLRHNREGQEGRRHMDPDAIDLVLRKHARAIG